MEKYEEAILGFIDKHKYLRNKNVLGIVLYGSYLYGNNDELSDIDIHVIMADDVNKIVRGVDTIYGFKIEYFEKPISDLYKSCDNDFNTFGNALLPIIGKGRIIVDKKGEIKKLQDYVLEKYSEKLPGMDNMDAKEMAVILENRISKLSKLAKEKRIDFNHQYHLLIEKIRKFYSRQLGCADIPPIKAYKIYTDSKYRDDFCKSDIPDKEFLSVYFKAINYNGTHDKKMELIYELYTIATKNINIDPNNYRIYVKSRNDIFNNAHDKRD